MENIIRDFIDWARNNSTDAFYVFDDTEEAIKRYMEFRKREEEELLKD